jgi:hypothetical protein
MYLLTLHRVCASSRPLRRKILVQPGSPPAVSGRAISQGSAAAKKKPGGVATGLSGERGEETEVSLP